MLQCSQTQEGNSSRKITKKVTDFICALLSQVTFKTKHKQLLNHFFGSNLTLHIPACVILSDLYAIEYVPNELP